MLSGKSMKGCQDDPLKPKQEEGLKKKATYVVNDKGMYVKAEEAD